MEKLITACGLDCSQCEAYIATKANDAGGRAKVAEAWSKMYDCVLTAEDCICEGCMQGGIISTAHANICAVRSCAIARKIPNCAHCEDYICDKLSGLFEYTPEARKALEDIRSKL